MIFTLRFAAAPSNGPNDAATGPVTTALVKDGDDDDATANWNVPAAAVVLLDDVEEEEAVVAAVAGALVDVAAIGKLYSTSTHAPTGNGIVDKLSRTNQGRIKICKRYVQDHE